METFDFLSGSPIVHTAFGGKKITAKKAGVETLHTSQVYSFGASQLSSVGNQLNKTEKVSVASRAQKGPEPAKHVGVLTVPESLKAQVGGEQALEVVA